MVAAFFFFFILFSFAVYRRDGLEMSCQICVCLFILIFVFNDQCSVAERPILIVFESLVAWNFARLTRDLPCHLLCNIYVYVQATRMKDGHVFA